MNQAVNCKRLLPAALRNSNRHLSFQRVTPPKTVLLCLRPNPLSANQPQLHPHKCFTPHHHKYNEGTPTPFLSTTALEYGWNGSLSWLSHIIL